LLDSSTHCGGIPFTRAIPSIEETAALVYDLRLANVFPSEDYRTATTVREYA
jgi:hypothetical protein